jgi:hypothetical protein
MFLMTAVLYGIAHVAVIATNQAPQAIVDFSAMDALANSRPCPTKKITSPSTPAKCLARQKPSSYG